MTEQSDIAEKQRRHYDKLIAQYAAHYDDDWSHAYRERFLHPDLFGDLDLRGLSVLDAMCGSGGVTRALVERGARVTGLDVSHAAIADYQGRFPGVSTKCSSLLSSGFADNSFDGVVVVGGLHHLQPNVSEAGEEILRILRPGGFFSFMEPHQGSIPDALRKIWYRLDGLFETNERAVDIDALESQFKERITIERRKFVGGIAYLFVLNSLVFRVPPAAKRFYSGTALKIEAMLSPLQSKRFSCVSVCRWRKLPE